MTIERNGIIVVGGKDATIVGPDIQVGQKAPEFAAQATDWSTFKALQKTKGKVRVIAALPSLNTSVCNRETRRFNQEAASLSEDIVILALSADLPYTQKDWCAGAGIDRVITLSDHMKTDFAKKYGVLIKERRILRRAVFVVDRKGKVVYAAYMPALGEEPDYEAVLNAARAAL